MKYQRMEQERTALLNRGTRHWLDDGRVDAATAQHEAGHAVVGRLLGLDVIGATIEPGVGYAGRTIWASEPDSFDLIVMLMAGSEAERLFGGPDDGCRNDLRHARALADTISDEIGYTIKLARRSARKILKANFPALTALAVALLHRRTLDLGEIEEIIRDRDGGMSARMMPREETIGGEWSLMLAQLKRKRRGLDPDDDAGDGWKFRDGVWMYEC